MLETLVMLENKLTKVQQLSRKNWIISIVKFVCFVLAIILVIFAALDGNFVMMGFSAFFWVIFAVCCITTLVINIVIAVNCYNSAIIPQSTKEMEIKDSLNTSMIMAIFGTLFFSMILNIVIDIRTSILLRQIHPTQ